MNIEIVRSKFPKSFDKAKNWMRNMIGQYGGYDKTTLDQLPMDDIIQVVLVHNTRNLFDFFDGLNIIMQIKYHSGSKLWSNKVGDIVSSAFTSRKEAEEDGFSICFDLLEKQI